MVQCASIQSFQLFRLYYCFSEHKIHSKHGYPQWVFVLMCVLLLLASILYFCIFLAAWMVNDCYIDHKGYAVAHTYNLFLEPWLLDILAAVVAFIFLFFDAATVILYWYKTNSLNISSP